jgi:hypothetical protein
MEGSPSTVCGAGLDKAVASRLLWFAYSFTRHDGIELRCHAQSVYRAKELRTISASSNLLHGVKPTMLQIRRFMRCDQIDNTVP